MRLAFAFSYIGTDFFGSQQQPDKRTVAGEIIRCLLELNLFESPKKADISISGRTDRGVHAKKQVIAFNTDHPERAVSAVNKKLPPDIRFNCYAEVPEGFNPRFAAKKRTYRYYFPEPAGKTARDFERMKEAASLFTGRHDFSRFSRPGDKNPEREIISSLLWQEDGFIVYEICGYSFLWNMVRCISYTLDMAGKGDMEADVISDALKNPSGSRFPAAPPHGLILWDVDCGVSFKPLDIHQKSRMYSECLTGELSQLKKMHEIW